jgi:hypothetical protein
MSLEELEKRVKAIEDLEEIKKLHQNYINLMDNLQYEKVLNLFTEDGTAEVRNSGVKKGRKGLAEIYIEGLAKKRGTLRDVGHMVIEPDITVAGNTVGNRFAVDYPTMCLGLSHGMAWTTGRLAGISAAAEKVEGNF